MKCKVCGKKLRFKPGTRYLIPVPKPIMTFNIENKKYFECFDCLYCGCQNRVNVREEIPPDPIRADILLTKNYEGSLNEKED